MSYINYSAYFDGYSLPDVVPGLTVLASNPYVPANRKLSSYNIARTNSSKIDSAFYDKRTLTVRVGITRATRALVETSLDTLMLYIQGREKELLLKQSGGTRKYICTYQDINFRVQGGSYLEFDLIFECSDHFGYDTAYTLLTQVTNYTSANKTDLINVGGSAPTQSALITLTYSAVTGGTGASVTVGNGTTGQTVTVTRTLIAGDVLAIDTLSPEPVTVNGLEVAFTGAIPEWAPGVGYLTYSDTIVTARTYSMTAKHYRRWV